MVKKEKDDFLAAQGFAAAKCLMRAKRKAKIIRACIFLERMPKEEAIQVTGKVIHDLSHGLYEVELENKHRVRAHPCGKMRKYRIKILPGDTVTLEISPYDLTRGRITYRFR